MTLRVGLGFVFLLIAATPLNAEVGQPIGPHGLIGPSGNSPTNYSQPPQYQLRLDAASVDAFVEEVAQQTAVEVERRLLLIVEQYQAQGIAFVEQALSRMIEKNLSAREVALLTMALELATDDQIQQAASAAAQARKAQRLPAWLNLAQTIQMKMAEKVNLVPEAQAVKILAEHTLKIGRLSEQAKLELRATQRTFKESLYLMRDKKIDGKGIAKLFSASVLLAKAAAGETVRDVKTALNPVEAERPLKAVALLANTVANSDPYSKMVLRNFLANELHNDRIVPDANGNPDWGQTLQKLAVSSPQQIQEVTRAMVAAKLINPEQARNVDRVVAHAEAGQRTVGEFATFLRENAGQQNTKSFQDQAQWFQRETELMRQRGQIGDDMALGVQQSLAAAMIGTNAVQAAQRIEALLENPITRRRLGMAERPQSPGRGLFR